MTGQLKQEKLCLSSNTDDLEPIAKVRPLTTQEIDLKSQYIAKLSGLLREDELKWYERSKAQFLLGGDSNTRYFHSVANGVHTKKLIHSRARLKDMGSSSHILHHITKAFLAPRWNQT
jgi:hypothetical protein